MPMEQCNGQWLLILYRFKFIGFFSSSSSNPLLKLLNLILMSCVTSRKKNEQITHKLKFMKIYWKWTVKSWRISTAVFLFTKLRWWWWWVGEWEYSDMITSNYIVELLFMQLFVNYYPHHGRKTRVGTSQIKSGSGMKWNNGHRINWKTTRLIHVWTCKWWMELQNKKKWFICILEQRTTCAIRRIGDEPLILYVFCLAALSGFQRPLTHIFNKMHSSRASLFNWLDQT